jgi:hypothetical protein
VPFGCERRKGGLHLERVLVVLVKGWLLSTVVDVQTEMYLEWKDAERVVTRE